jgi:hypothetical protein
MFRVCLEPAAARRAHSRSRGLALGTEIGCLAPEARRSLWPFVRQHLAARGRT